MISINIREYLDSYEKYASNDFDTIFKNHLTKLHEFHNLKCLEYKNISEKIFNISHTKAIKKIENFPFLPVDIFKKYEIFSCKSDDIYKILKSSGTSNQVPSKIFLTKENARDQSIGLLKIFKSFTKLNRPNLIIIDSPDLIKDKKSFNARVAGIIGFRSLSKKAIYGLNNKYELEIEKIENFIDENHDHDLLIFGFTWIIFKYFINKNLPKSLKEKLSNSVLLHGGGWKKIEDLSVSKREFNDIVKERSGIKRVISYYGMIEQTGSIFLECENGYLHTNPLANIICRSESNLKTNEINKRGLAQVLSAIPTSYPGHSLLTDDIVEIKHYNNCPCGRKGLAFIVHGRAKKTEIRGCSDTL